MILKYNEIIKMPDTNISNIKTSIKQDHNHKS